MMKLSELFKKWKEISQTGRACFEIVGHPDGDKICFKPIPCFSEFPDDYPPHRRRRYREDWLRKPDTIPDYDDSVRPENF
jgi:hypothetical protein